MLLNDLVLHISLFLFQILFFFLLHVIVLRIFAKSNILYSSTLTIFLSVMSVTLLSYVLISGLFSSTESYVVAAAGIMPGRITWITNVRSRHSSPRLIYL